MQDQGFDETEKAELIQFNYRPYSIHGSLGKRTKTLRPFKNTELMLKLPINDELRQQFTESVLAKGQQQIVFNNFNSEVGIFENQVSFEADFESSNLELVIRRKHLDYELYIRPDSNTNTHFQWFYFRVKSKRSNKNVSFTIKNFIKNGMLYNDGLRPYFKSSLNPNEGYKQLQTEVCYSQNYNDEYFSLKFNYDLHPQQIVQFCSQPPYSYSIMLQRVKKSKGKALQLCKTVQGRKVPYLIYNDTPNIKAMVIVIARQHPGQTVGSWMMEGMLSKLDELQQTTIMWVMIPMMNPDGVFLGNNRTGFNGYDYNRFWSWEQISRKNPNFPEIIGCVDLVKTLRKKHGGKPRLFLDLHGHSSQPNVFSYGPPHEESSENFLLSRTFPELMSMANQNFNLKQSSYTIRPDKKNTSRSLFYNYLGFSFSYTIEASFGVFNGKRVRVDQFTKMGQDLARVAQDFLCNYVIGETSNKQNDLLRRVEQRAREQTSAEEYDSQDQEVMKKIQKKIEAKRVIKPFQASTQCYRAKLRIATEGSIPYPKLSTEMGSLPLFKAQKTQKQRYGKNSQRQLPQEIGIKSSKAHFLPVIKESLNSKKKLETQSMDYSETPAMININELQKRLFKLRNSRIGKKILIINAYGV